MKRIIHSLFTIYNLIYVVLLIGIFSTVDMNPSWWKYTLISLLIAFVNILGQYEGRSYNE